LFFLKKRTIGVHYNLFLFLQEHGARRSLYDTLQRFAFPKSHKHDVFAFEYRATFPVNGWEVYNARSEFERMVIPRLSEHLFRDVLHKTRSLGC
jgi:hypothetical protein